jgi:hypothetical protein
MILQAIGTDTSEDQIESDVIPLLLTRPSAFDAVPVDVTVKLCTRPMLIGIAGPKRAGKDTLARKLATLFNLPQDSFAAPLRRFVADLLSWTLDELEVRKEDPVDWLGGVTARHMMQTVGTEWGRDMVHGELWVLSLLQRVAKTGGIISDVRFPNEALAIRERGGIVIHVSRPGTGRGDQHRSEVPLPPSLVDAYVRNDSTPDDLAFRAVVAIRGINGRA